MLLFFFILSLSINQISAQTYSQIPCGSAPPGIVTFLFPPPLCFSIHKLQNGTFERLRERLTNWISDCRAISPWLPGNNSTQNPQNAQILGFSHTSLHLYFILSRALLKYWKDGKCKADNGCRRGLWITFFSSFLSHFRSDASPFIPYIIQPLRLCWVNFEKLSHCIWAGEC